MARECLKKQAEYRALRYDFRVKKQSFSVGQFVWKYYPRARKSLKTKWLKFYTGPFRVEERVGPVLYKLRQSPRSQPCLVYIDYLKLYSGPTPPKWSGKPNDEPEEAPLVPEQFFAEDEVEDRPVLSPRPARKVQRPARYMD